MTVTDQAGKKRRSLTNALGQLTRVDEPNESGQLDVSGTPAQPSIYSYDALNNLLQVQQIGTTTQQCGGSTSNCTQTRTFVYDNLSRLKQATNPESGTISYSYDDNGNLTGKTDARSISTAYNYDALNRVLQRSYSNEPAGQSPTGTVNYTYDGVSHAKGQLTKVTTAGSGSTPFSVTDYQVFDVMGRITQSQQSTDGTIYPAQTYTYNLSGAMLTEVYPSGRVVQNTLDNDGRLAQLESSKTSTGSFKVYANSFTYTAAGAVSSMRLGNGKWESTQFNSRLQPTQIALGTSQQNALGTSPTATNQLKLDFSYGTTANNGNVQSQSITVPTVGSNPGFTAVQNYTYDSLNRIKQADEKPSGYTQEQCDANPTKCWKQTFTYDRFGNRNFDEAHTTETATFLKNCGTEPNKTVCALDVPIMNPSIYTAKNQLNGSTFDAAGNTTKTPQNRKFTYDGENKQIKVETVDSNGDVTGTLGEYWYDGDGKRVKKYSFENNQWITTIFVYDASGKMVAEYSTQLATTPEVSYLTNDHLGSPRINTDANGAVTARHDYQPFGEEIATSQRIAGLGYKSDEIRKKFTSYERDTETNLDFAQARMFGSVIGRFTTPDPSMKISLTNPQSWNKYIYALNNPHKFVDKDGRWPTTIHDLILRLAFPNLSSEQINAMQVGSFSVDVPWTLFEEYANQHAMRRNDQTVEDAKREMDKFIAEKSDLAQANNDGGDNPSINSLYNFGQAMHPIMDNTSPTHRPFQVFDNSNMWACVVDPYACYLFWEEMEVHKRGESTIFQGDLNQSVSDARQKYRSLYGDKALNLAVGIFPNATLIFDNAPINGNSKPSGLNVGNLGSVTVYPDGKEKYEGPLEKIK